MIMEKENIISEIKSIIRNDGSFNVAQIEWAGDLDIPVDDDNIEKVVTVDIDGVYCDNDDFVPYEFMHENSLADVLLLCENWKVDCEKTLKRCQS